MSELIIVAGGSCSGKTMLAHALAAHFGSGSACVCSVDDYYKDLSESDKANLDSYNFDAPAAIDSYALIEDLSMLLNGLTINSPVYDFKKHCKGEYRIIEPKDIVVLEGLFALNFALIRSYASTSVFVECDESVRLKRRIARDVKKRGFSRDEIVSRFSQSVEPMFEKHVANCAKHCDLIINGEEPIAKSIEEIVEHSRKMTC